MTKGTPATLARAQRMAALNHAISPLLVLMAAVTADLVLTMLAAKHHTPVAQHLGDIIRASGVALTVGLVLFVWRVSLRPVEAPSLLRALPALPETPGQGPEIVERLLAPLPAAREAVYLPNALIGPAHMPALLVVLFAVFTPPTETQMLAELLASAVAGTAVTIWGIVLATELSRASQRHLDAATSIAAGGAAAGLRIPPPCEKRAKALGGLAYLRDYVTLASTVMVLRCEQYVAMTGASISKPRDPNEPGGGTSAGEAPNQGV